MAEPTDKQLRAAWRALATPEWGDFDQARKTYLRFAIARSRARVAASGRPIEPAPTAVAAATTPPCWHGLRVSHPEPMFDCKRAAAGDRDE